MTEIDRLRAENAAMRRFHALFATDRCTWAGTDTAADAARSTGTDIWRVWQDAALAAGINNHAENKP